MHEFQMVSYNTAREMIDAMCEAWLSAGGANDEALQREFLTNTTDDFFAAEVIDHWELGHVDFGDDERRTWLQKRNIDRADIVQGFARLRSRLTSPQA